MSEKKQTAVMWLLEQQANMYNLLQDNISLQNYQRVKEDIINKALQMERDQIEEAYADGYLDRHSDEITIKSENNRI